VVEVILRASVISPTAMLAHFLVAKGGGSLGWIVFTGHVLAGKKCCQKSIAFPSGLVTGLSLLSHIAGKRLVFLPLQIAAICQMFPEFSAS